VKLRKKKKKTKKKATTTATIDDDKAERKEVIKEGDQHQRIDIMSVSSSTSGGDVLPALLAVLSI